ncbi:hypothetical protein JOD45_003021 [Scopulibacillus daqui]|uniref:Knr4/Smi1-like domain-containing protein n=1 Tax=Scopulibacillus daqui TaxID=1469162 RepID=A0ABS2Q3B6_9BACL|nr:SMI1/KNR4 family protein [Scopulibacillus daqui]MBM7646787.1 hypothetical protein [Scopulibacillus daqui]
MTAKIKGFGTKNELQVLEFEKKIGFELPNDYREFLKKV